MKDSAMWYSEIPAASGWSSLWHGYIRCECGGIRRYEGFCGACSQPLAKPAAETIIDANGTESAISVAAYMGGEGRYEDWVYLRILEREWLRPLTDADKFLDVAESRRPSPRAAFILTFWTYFETRIERLFREALRRLPQPIVDDLLRRNSSIGARLETLYKVCFDTTYLKDLRQLGYQDVAETIAKVHKRRNYFAHGHPEAIDDLIVTELVERLKREHEGWIAVFNERLAHGPGLAP